MRIGDTVRRPLRPFSLTVQAYPAHLRDAGFTGAPLPFGIDEQGREMLSFVPGDVPRNPLPPETAGDDVLVADAPGIVLAFSDPVMQRFSWRTAPYTETNARDYFAEQEEARLRGEGLDFALVEPRDQDVVLGGVSLHEVRLDRGCAAVGYWLAPGAHGRGLATYAVRLLARWAFAELGLARLELTCGPDNVASQHVAERCGFPVRAFFAPTCPSREPAATV